jgi:hypothetical protein
MREWSVCEMSSDGGEQFKARAEMGRSEGGLPWH